MTSPACAYFSIVGILQTLIDGIPSFSEAIAYRRDKSITILGVHGTPFYSELYDFLLAVL